MKERAGRWLTRRRVAAVLVAFATAVAYLKVSDWSSMESSPRPRSFRLFSANVKDAPFAALEAIEQYSPDVVALQETGPWDSCIALARAVGYTGWSGADQCVLTAPRIRGSNVGWRSPWPGARQRPQQIRLEGSMRLGVVNLHLARPSLLPGEADEGSGKKVQYGWLRDNIAGDAPTMACGDFNDFPWRVELGSGFADSWRREALGATFPAWLPIVRIDQCWTSGAVVVHDAWTVAIPSDHRGLMVEFALEPLSRGPAE
jgi:endonuclease/exonuclease/phosphatase (EEP) superfamily protein YafD